MASPVTIPAGAMGLTEGTRSVLDNEIRQGTPQSLDEFAERMGDNLTATGKAMAVGAATGLAGAGAGTAVRAVGGGTVAQGAGRLAGEAVAMPTAAAGMEGRLPEARDFADSAALILGMKALGGAGKGTAHVFRGGKKALEARLRTIYEQTGITPEQAARDIRHDPALLEAMRAPGKPLPEPFTAEAASTAPAYQTALRELYSDDRSIKMVFRETGVEPSLKDRSQLRSYLESLDPKQVARLKLDSSQDYLAVLKAIVRKFFPKTGELRFRRGEDGRTLDYEHFVDRDIVRNDYLGTLPSTLRNRDIRVEFTTAEGEAKAYLIRKYLDADTQKDIWDMLVVRDGELKTKIARREKRGQNYVETQIMKGAGDTVSQPATTGGATENTSTPRDSTLFK